MIRPVLDWCWPKVNNRRDQTARDGNWQTNETLLINLRRALGQRPRPACPDIEPRQTKPSADDEHERQKPRQSPRVHPALQSRALAPGVPENCRRQPEPTNTSQ